MYAYLSNTICRNAIRDAANFHRDLDTTTPDRVPKPVEPSPSNDNNFTSTAVKLNGAANNIHSFTSNQTIVVPSIDLPTSESQPTEDSSVSAENLNSSQLPDTNTTASDAHQLSPEAQQISLQPTAEAQAEFAPAIQPSAEVVINSALEDATATSTVPPVVEAQESDLRDTTSPLALAPVQSDAQPDTSEMEPELAIGKADTAMHTSGAPNLTLNNGLIGGSALPSSDTPSPENATPPVKDEPSTAVSQDTEMTDALESAPSAKVSRGREDDNDNEPSAKRTKTEDTTMTADIPGVNVQTPPELPPAAPQTDDPASATSQATTITNYEAKEIIKILKNVVRTKDGKNFKAPVSVLWPSIAENYYARIPHPVDLATMETNLRDGKYATMDDFKADANLIASNALLFNGENHSITTSGQVVRESILTKLASIPPEPATVPKAPKKQARKSTPVGESTPRTTAPHRQSRSGGASSVANATPTQAFALDPTTNTPLIRRDSTKGDGGRPKREIHPPKNKDLPYTTSRPKNKKVALELKFCEEVLADMRKPKHAKYNHHFLNPVDPVSMNIPNYFQIVKHPMDMSYAAKKLKEGGYSSAKQFENDMKLMFSNCYSFNPPSDPVHVCGTQLEAVFNELWAKKQQWLADHAPAAQTPSTNGGSDDEESEEDEEVEEPAQGPSAVHMLNERLNEEQEKLINMLGHPGNEPQLIEVQKEMIKIIKQKIADAKATPPAKKVVKKPRAPKAAKKQAPAKKPAVPKKSAPARQKYLGTHEKNIISLGIQRLPEHIIKEILAMIKGETDVDVSMHQSL